MLLRPPRVALAVATVTRRLPRLRGMSLLAHAVYRSLPREGLRVARFGRRRAIRCDLRSGYDRSVFAGREERLERLLLERLLSSGETFVDAGANIGLFTIFGAAAVAPGGTVFAFEPVLPTYRSLAATVNLQHLTRMIVLERKALAGRSGDLVTLTGEAHNIMRVSAAGSPPTDDGHGIDTAPTITLDDALPPGTHVHGMKIDVEGHELEVLLGASETIQRCRPWMLVEFNSEITGIRRLGDWEVHRHLISLGYSAHTARAVYHDDLTALSDEWVNHLEYDNLLYLAALPVPLLLRQAARARGTRRSRLRRWLTGPARQQQLLRTLARPIVAFDRCRRTLWRAFHRRRRTPTLQPSDARVLATVAHFRSPGADHRPQHMLTVVDGLLGLQCEQVCVVVISNDELGAADDLREHLRATGREIPVHVTHDARSSVGAATGPRSVVVQKWHPQRFRRHGFYLTWAHVPILRAAMVTHRFTHLMYLEDDIHFTDRHLRYWCEHRALLLPTGAIPSFTRFERHEGERYSVELRYPADPLERALFIDDGGTTRHYVNLEMPYQGMYVLDEGLAEEHLRFSPMRSPFLSRTRPWLVRERAVTGPIRDDVPAGLRTRNVVAVIDDGEGPRMHPDCQLEHLAANYVTDPSNLFASIPSDHVFDTP